jgi:ATP-binding cassette, sub-family E, member 1
MNREGNKEKNKLTRVAIVLEDKCKPQLCQLECKRACPVNRQGKPCIVVEKVSKISQISETLCIGCGACQKKCPFGAIKIINLPTSLGKDISHRYGENSFKLHRLPVPRAGKVLGLIGTNGIGKSTALAILAGQLKPNLGEYKGGAEWSKILTRYRGSELYKYFTKLIEDRMSISHKTQYVDKIPRECGEATLKDLMEKSGTEERRGHYYAVLELEGLRERRVKDLSGGELQRLAIAKTALEEADVYMFDEPSSYLDVRQRLVMARVIRELCSDKKYVIVVEHDLSVLDMLCDYTCVLYGSPGAYGVISHPFTCREGINIFLSGVLPTENMRFREEGLVFKMGERVAEGMGLEASSIGSYGYGSMQKTFKSFSLQVKQGRFFSSEIVVLLGENGMGKSSFVKMLAGEMEPDGGASSLELRVSVKPQKIIPKYEGTVRSLFLAKAKACLVDALFVTEVTNPLGVNGLLDRKVKELSGGELQRVAISLALGRDADLYLIDEPSAYLDSDQRIIVSKAIKRFVLNRNKSAFVVEHDLIMATYMADRVIVFEGEPGVRAEAGEPESLSAGMNRFLKGLGVTFRRDPENLRPRINKVNSVKDREQRERGCYFFESVEE